MTKPKSKNAILAGEEDTRSGTSMPAGGARSSREAPEDEENEGSPTPGMIASTSLYVEADGRYHINFDDDRKKGRVKTAREAYALLCDYFKDKLDIDDD